MLPSHGSKAQELTHSLSTRRCQVWPSPSRRGVATPVPGMTVTRCVARCGVWCRLVCGTLGRVLEHIPGKTLAHSAQGTARHRKLGVLGQVLWRLWAGCSSEKKSHTSQGPPSFCWCPAK
jgi:hypothetical protein